MEEHSTTTNPCDEERATVEFEDGWGMEETKHHGVQRPQDLSDHRSFLNTLEEHLAFHYGFAEDRLLASWSLRGLSYNDLIDREREEEKGSTQHVRRHRSRMRKTRRRDRCHRFDRVETRCGEVLGDGQCWGSSSMSERENDTEERTGSSDELLQLGSLLAFDHLAGSQARDDVVLGDERPREQIIPLEASSWSSIVVDHRVQERLQRYLQAANVGSASSEEEDDLSSDSSSDTDTQGGMNALHSVAWNSPGVASGSRVKQERDSTVDCIALDKDEWVAEWDDYPTFCETSQVSRRRSQFLTKDDMDIAYDDLQGDDWSDQNSDSDVESGHPMPIRESFYEDVIEDEIGPEETSTSGGGGRASSSLDYETLSSRESTWFCDRDKDMEPETMLLKSSRGPHPALNPSRPHPSHNVSDTSLRSDSCSSCLQFVCSPFYCCLRGCCPGCFSSYVAV